jgi:hypothetical protein
LNTMNVRINRRLPAKTTARFGALVLCAGNMLLAGCARGADFKVAEQPDLSTQLNAAKELAVEDMDAPIKAVNTGDTMIVPNPDGKTFDVLQWYFKSYDGPTEVFIIDLATGQIKKDTIPDNLQINVAGRTVGPDGKLYIATEERKNHSGMNIFVYDPATNTLTDRGVIVPKLVGGARPMTVGADGMIYGSGNYLNPSKVGIYQLDPKTGKITDYGAVGPDHKPNDAWGYYVGADDEWVYVASGKIPWYLVAYNRKTKAEKVLFTTTDPQDELILRQQPDGVIAIIRHLKNNPYTEDSYWLYNGEMTPKKDDNAPWPKRDVPAALPRPEVFYDALTADTQGNATLWYLTQEAHFAAQKNNAAKDATPQERGWKSVPLKGITTYPTLIRRLVTTPNGKLLGTGDYYVGQFEFDPATGKSKYLGRTPLSHYGTAFKDGKVYLTGYPTSPVFVYDPKKPWSLGQSAAPGQEVNAEAAGANPRRLAYLKDATRVHKMYGAAAPEGSSKVYFGGQKMRDGDGGGIGWWDTKTQTVGGFWEGLDIYAIGALTATDNGRFVVASTWLDSSDPIPAGTSAKLFVVDAQTNKVVREIVPVEGAKSTGWIAEAKPGIIFGQMIDPKNANAGVLYGVDVRSGEVLFRKSIPASVREFPDTWGTGDFQKGPDGNIYAYAGSILMRIHPDDARIEIVGRVTPGAMGFGGNDIYLGGAENLRRIKGVVQP